MEHAGWISLVPALVTLALALVFRKTFEALIGGCIVGLLTIETRKWMADSAAYDGIVPMQAFKEFVTILSKVMADPVIVWITLVVGLFGSLIALVARAGGSLAFGRVVGGLVSGRRSALFATWLLGVLIFIDDYLNALTVGTAMRRLVDRFRISRQMLAYVVDSTSAPVCVLVPFSTWAVYTAGLLEENGMAAKGEGLLVYVSTIPFILYAMVAIAVVLLVALGVIPVFGPMKRAEEVAARGESTANPGAAAFLDQESDSKVPIEKARLINFTLPIGVLIFYTWFSGVDLAAGKWFGAVDALQGVMAAIVVASVLFLAQRLMTVEEFSHTFFHGFSTMLMPIGIVISSFILVDINNALGLTPFVLESVGGLMTAAMLPVLVFLSMGFVAFATGSFWGMYAVSLPVVLPLAANLGCSPQLAVGAVVSAGAFGSHLCPFGDSTVLSSTGAGCDNMSHVTTQAPYGLICALITSVAFALAGVLMA